MVHIQKGLVEIGQVQVVLGFVVLFEGLVFRRWELTERSKVCVDVRNIEAVRLVKIAIPGGMNASDILFG